MAQNLSNLPIGAKVKFGKHSINGETALPITWMVVAKNHSSTPAYPTNSVTLITERIIDLRAFDGREPTNPNADRKYYGNNTYSLSNIDQWLNSDKSNWYTATHSYDTPPNNDYTGMGTPYDTRPGFLSNFSDAEKNLLLLTNIRAATYDTPYNDISRKVFLPSAGEMGVTSTKDGSQWEYFNSNDRRKAFVTEQCYSNTLTATKPTDTNTPWYWWTRSATSAYAQHVHIISITGGSSNANAMDGYHGIRPAINLQSTLSISDTTDSSGAYTVVWNSAPPVPTTLNVPTIYGGKSATISWSSVNDPDGNAVTYQLEQSVNGGAFTTIYTGANLSYSTVVPYGTTNVQFRVRATDSLGASSGYITSTNRTVINNNAPTIDGTNSSLGTKSSEFTQTYKVTDAENNPVTVVESIDGVQIRSYVVTLGATNSFSVTGNTWLSLTNGSHTMTVRATDGVDTATRTYTFVKSVNSLTITTRNPMATNTRPTRIKVIVNKTIPAEATMKIEACNNGFDSSPTWEDITTSMNNGLIHLFSNTTKTATQWGVRIRVTINRNGGSGACYVSSIGGNWE